MLWRDSTPLWSFRVKGNKPEIPKLTSHSEENKPRISKKSSFMFFHSCEEGKFCNDDSECGDNQCHKEWDGGPSGSIGICKCKSMRKCEDDSDCKFRSNAFECGKNVQCIFPERSYPLG